MTINKTEYPMPELNFSAMCKMEEWGLSISDISTRPLGFLAGFVGLAIGKNMKDGQEAIDAYLLEGGDLDALTDELNLAVNKSGFFRKAEETKEAHS